MVEATGSSMLAHPATTYSEQAQRHDADELGYADGTKHFGFLFADVNEWGNQLYGALEDVLQGPLFELC